MLIRTGSTLFYYSLAILVGEYLFRLLNVYFEFSKFKKHYPIKNRTWYILKSSLMPCTKSAIFFLVIFCAIIVAFWITDENFLQNFCKNVPLVFVSVFIKYIGIDKSNLDMAKWIRSDYGLDYATGMASNYFHGYIHLQLPNKGDGNKGIKERCEDYEDKENAKFAIKKLLILIPHSLYSKPKIESKLLEKAKPLETVVKGRAGVSRPFRNDVYRITEKINGNNYYITVEGATPLLSFFEAINFTLTSTPQMVAMQTEILIQFYKSIKKFCLTCPDTQNDVEFIYYNDYDATGKLVDVGEVVKNYVEKVINDENSLK